MLFLTSDQDNAQADATSIFFAHSLDDRSTAKKTTIQVLKFLFVIASIIALPMLKDSLSHFVQHAGAQALHIDETLVGIFLALATKLPELSKLFNRPCSEESFSFNLTTCTKDQ